MNPKAKKFLSNFFFGLLSNDHAIEGAKSNPWWVALIIGFFAAVIPVIPITVSQAKTYGASFLSTYTYRFDQNIAKATVELASANKEFKVESAELTYLENNAPVEVNTSNDVNPVYTHVSESTHQYELMIYFTNREKADLKTFVNDIASKTYVYHTVDATPADYEGTVYAPSFVVLSKTSLYTRLNKDDSNAVGSNTYTTYSADWKHFKDGSLLIADALPEGKTAAQVDLNKSSDVEAIYNTWKDYYNKSYLTQKTYNTWMTSLLFLGIYVALELVMGLLVFLLTRGKNNMFNYLKWIDTQKIVWWASLAPAILAMIMGFILSQFAQMMFIILLGLRVMWISMKQLRPQY